LIRSRPLFLDDELMRCQHFAVLPAWLFPSVFLDFNYSEFPAFDWLFPFDCLFFLIFLDFCCFFLIFSLALSFVFFVILFIFPTSAAKEEEEEEEEDDDDIA